jgi:hypothetical protein
MEYDVKVMFKNIKLCQRLEPVLRRSSNERKPAHPPPVQRPHVEQENTRWAEPVPSIMALASIGQNSSIDRIQEIKTKKDRDPSLSSTPRPVPKRNLLPSRIFPYYVDKDSWSTQLELELR